MNVPMAELLRRDVVPARTHNTKKKNREKKNRDRVISSSAASLFCCHEYLPSSSLHKHGQIRLKGVNLDIKYKRIKLMVYGAIQSH